jgi:hypothetical protein
MRMAQLKAIIEGSVQSARQCNRWVLLAKKDGDSFRTEVQRSHREEWMENARISKSKLGRLN